MVKGATYARVPDTPAKASQPATAGRASLAGSASSPRLTGMAILAESDEDRRSEEGLLEDEEEEKATVTSGRAGGAKTPSSSGARSGRSSGATTADEFYYAGTDLPANTPAADRVVGKTVRLMWQSPWMSLFQPEPAVRADYPELWKELWTAISEVSARRVAEQTIKLLEKLGCKVGRVPHQDELDQFKVQYAREELGSWKIQLMQSLGWTTTRGPNGRGPPGNTPAKMAMPTSSGSGVTPDTEEGMKTPPRSTQLEDVEMESVLKPTKLNFDSPGLAKSGSSAGVHVYGGSDDEEDPTDQFQEIRELAMNNSQPGRKIGSTTMTLATPVPLKKLELFYGDRDRTDEAMTWLKTFIVTMKMSQMPMDQWIAAFELRLRGGALHWFKQLSRRTSKKWTALAEAFMQYYCVNKSATAETRYYNASRRNHEHVLDYLLRLNHYARKAKINFSGGDRAREHIRQFLSTCGEEDLVDRFYHLQLADVDALGEMIQMKLRGEESKHRRGSSRNREYSRRDESSRRDRSRDDSKNHPRVTLAEASMEDLMAEMRIREDEGYSGGRKRLTSSNPRQRHDYGRHYFSDEDDDSDYYLDTALAEDEDRRHDSRSDEYRRQDDFRPSQRAYPGQRSVYNPQQAQPGRPQYSQYSSQYPRSPRRDGYQSDITCGACGGKNHHAHECRKRCPACGLVHRPGECEKMQQMSALMKFVVSKFKDDDLPDEIKDMQGRLNPSARQH